MLFLKYSNYVGCTRLVAQVIKFTSYLPMVGGSHRVLRLLPPLKVALNTKNQNSNYVNDMLILISYHLKCQKFNID